MQQWPDLGFGVCLKARHYREFLQDKPGVDWLEVHTENYFGKGGLDLHVLQELRQDYPFSLHGVGLGIGSSQGFSKEHLARVADLVRKIEPALVSEHLCWGALQDRNLNDLLPLNLTDQALDLVCQRVWQIQDVLRRPILLENVSTYLRYQSDQWSEAGFLAEVVKRTGCGVLLDVNNLYVNWCNHREDPLAAIAALPLGCVGEIHLAGHSVTEQMVVDDHGSEVVPEVWDLYRAALARFGRVASVIEWDTNVPPLAQLLAQAQLAREHAQHVLPLDLPAVPETAARKECGLTQNQQQFGANLFAPIVAPTIFSDFTGEPGKREHGFGMYRGNLRAHWNAALEGAYPVLKKLVGDEFFSALVYEYGLRYPSQSGDLNQFGAHFAVFLAEFEHVAQYPYFPDMARLEWGLHLAYYAADATALGIQEIASLTPEALDETHFALHPACVLLSSAWAVGAIWEAHQVEPVADFPDPLATQSYVLIARKNFKPVALTISHAAFVALSALQQGHALGPALDAALEIDEDFAFLEQLQLWLAHEVLCASGSAN